MKRERFASQPKLPILKVPQLFQSPVKQPSREFFEIQQKHYKTYRVLNKQNTTDQSTHVLNSSIRDDLKHNQQVITRMDETVYKCKSIHQQHYQTIRVFLNFDYRKKMMTQSQQQKAIKKYPLKFEVKEISLGSNATTKRVISLQFHNNQVFLHKASTIWIPQVREMTMAALFNGNAYVFGGIGNEVRSDLIQYNLSSQSFQVVQQKGDKPQSRYGHCFHSFPYPMAVYTQYQLDNFNYPAPILSNYSIIFGGELSFNVQLRIRENLNDVRLLNMDTFEWIQVKPNLEAIPDTRRCFGSCMIAKGLLVHGGLKSRFQFLHDLHYLNLSICKWIPIDQFNDPFANGIGFHQLIPVFIKPQLALDKRPKKPNADWEGIYCFGGCYADKDKQNKYYKSFLYILQVQAGQWSIPETSGAVPRQRILHTATHIQDLNIIVIIGGRDDQFNNPYFNEIIIYKILEKSYIIAESLGEQFKPRAGHMAFNYQSKILLFGGVNMEGYIDGGLDIMEFNPTEIRSLQSQDAANKWNQQEFLAKIEQVHKEEGQRQIRSISPKKSMLMKALHIEHENSVSKKKRLREEEIKKLSFEQFSVRQL